MCRRRFVSVRCPIAWPRLLERRDTRESISAIGFPLLLRASRVPDSKEITRSNSRVSGTNAVRAESPGHPSNAGIPKQKIGKPSRDAERTISASSSLVRGLRKFANPSAIEAAEWTSLTQISFSRSAKTRGASAKKRRRAYEIHGALPSRELTEAG